MELTSEILHLIHRVLPSHVWIHALTLCHIDSHHYTMCTDIIPHACFEDITFPFGHITTVLPDVLKMKNDVIFVTFYHNHFAHQTFYQFLQSINGNAEAYKEMMILITGENPWK